MKSSSSITDQRERQFNDVAYLLLKKMASETEIRQKAQDQGLSGQEINQAVNFGSSNPNLSADEVIKKYKQSK